MRQFNFYGYITLYGIFFLIVLYKVFNVPVTIDELPTVIFYSNFSFWEIMMYPDNIPNNHILNTLLAKFSIILFGKEQWAIRLPSLLSFIVFAYAIFRILKHLIKIDSWLFLPAAILFINPYLLDFFGLCRGYAISITMVCLTVAFLVEGYQNLKTKYIWIALFTALLASYANFSALVFWAAVTIMVWFYFVVINQGKLKKLIKPTLIIFIISVAYFALILTPIIKMQSTDEFQYWTSHGFYKETVESLQKYWIYDSDLLWKLFPTKINRIVIAIVAINLLFFALKPKRKEYFLERFTHPGFIGVALFLLPAFVNICQIEILGTPNLNGRTALFFYPLLSAAAVIAIALIAELKISWLNKSLAIGLGLTLIANFSHRVSLTSVKEWYFDENTIEVIDYLEENYKGKQIVLKTGWHFHSSFTFYCDTGKAPWIKLRHYDKNIDAFSDADYYYVFAKDYEKLAQQFKVAYKFNEDRWLLKRR